MEKIIKTTKIKQDTPSTTFEFSDYQIRHFAGYSIDDIFKNGYVDIFTLNKSKAIVIAAHCDRFDKLINRNVNIEDNVYTRKSRIVYSPNVKGYIITLSTKILTSKYYGYSKINFYFRKLKGYNKYVLVGELQK